MGLKNSKLYGFIILLLSHVLFYIALLFYLLVLKEPISLPDDYPVWLLSSFSIFQFIYAGPLIYFFNKRGMKQTVIGIWVGAGTTINLNLVWLVFIALNG
uniref:Uncharacterized protein n=1 Tax=Magnetococcus massalia (strain MO-1) TaxID=451514 RepID=A0A1S7LND5_MAGMO|nr:Membrane protein of unknown function [Candidatus Magnetococcus massalia]